MVKSKKRDVNSFKEKISKVLNKKRPSKKHEKHKSVRHSSHKTKQKKSIKSSQSPDKIRLSYLDELKKYIETQLKNGKISSKNADHLIKYAEAIKSKVAAGAPAETINKMTEELKKQWVKAHDEHLHPVNQATHVQHHTNPQKHSVAHHQTHQKTHSGTNHIAKHHTQHTQAHQHVAHKAPVIAHTQPVAQQSMSIEKPIDVVSTVPKKENSKKKNNVKNQKDMSAPYSVHHTNMEDGEDHHERKISSNFRTDKDIAMDFATKVHKKFDHLIKASILFGSQTSNEIKPGSDIDIVFVIDDAAINWDMELTAWYREELAKIISEEDYGRDLHVNTIRLTTWWRDLLHGDPVILNIVRQGQVLIDIAGFFTPVKSLLMQGKIHATPEAVYSALQRSPQHLTRSKLSMLGAIEGVYWCMVEAAQAALITLGKLPPSPEHVTKMLHESFVESGVLKSDYVKWYRDIYILHKQIAHGEIRQVKASEIEAWQNRAEDFMKTMVNIIDRLIESRKSQEQK